MTTVILAGGLGTRLGRLTANAPKPMVPLCGKPIIEHIINYYKRFGHKRFIICAGYQVDVILDYFKSVSHEIHCIDDITILCQRVSDEILVVNTGIDAGTAIRVAQIEKYIEDEEFFLTYSDGLSNIDLEKLDNIHMAFENTVTVSAVHPIENFGVITFSPEGKVKSFAEKERNVDRWINGGFIKMNREIFTYIRKTDMSLEKDVFPRVVADGNMGVYLHDGFWQCMDTVEEKEYLESLLVNRTAPWIK